MKTIPCRSMWGLAALVAVTGAMLLTTSDQAIAQSQLSDELLITLPGGPVLADVFLPEGPAGAELTATFPPGALVPPPVPLPIALTLPGISAVVLTDPPGEVPTEPPLVLPGTNLIISDVVISTLGVDPALGFPPFISMLSDGDPDLQQLVDRLATLPGLVVLPETGAFQDLTPFLVSPINNPFGPINVFVRSDAVPEPAGIVLAGLALVGLAAWARRQRAR